jgi:hypothetical protein
MNHITRTLFNKTYDSLNYHITKKLTKNNFYQLGKIARQPKAAPNSSAHSTLNSHSCGSAEAATGTQVLFVVA